MPTHTLPDVLVTTEWVAQHATDTGVRVVEVDVDTSTYDQGHVPGAAGWNWTTQLCDTLVRDIIPAKKLGPGTYSYLVQSMRGDEVVQSDTLEFDVADEAGR